ncbi:MAG: cytidine deaminase [Lachnospiraceae bacterium]
MNIKKTSELTETEKVLVDTAIDMMNMSYAPYSRFSVGAALLSADGKVFTGCNIENGAFSATVCAERTAFFKAVSEGTRKFEAIAIAGGREGIVTSFCPPCGTCRQVMSEFCDPDIFRVILTDGKQNVREYFLSELLPYGFGL